MKRLIVTALVLASATFGLSSTARAVCAVQGEVVRTTETAASMTAYVRTGGLATYVYAFTTPNATLREALHSAEATGHRVYVAGSAAACPVAGDIRAGGVVGTVIINP